MERKRKFSVHLEFLADLSSGQKLILDTAFWPPKLYMYRKKEGRDAVRVPQFLGS